MKQYWTKLTREERNSENKNKLMEYLVRYADRFFIAIEEGKMNGTKKKTKKVLV